MPTFVQKQKEPQRATAAGRTHFGHSPSESSIFHVQRTIGNQGLQRLLQASTRNIKAGSLTDRVSSTGIQATLSQGPAADSFERDADRTAERVLNMSEPVAGTSEHKRGGNRTIQRGDQALSSQERSYFEPRFGHDFSQVRIHDDARSARMADTMNAEAFTFGRDIYFGAGMRRPEAKDGNRLLAHELAHVVQQSRIGPTLQPKLKLTGAPDLLARVAAVLNAGLGSFYYVSVDSSGEVKMVPVRAAHTSSATGPSTQVAALADQVWNLTTESGTTTVDVVAGGVPIVGSYALSQIDIADMEALGTGLPGWNSSASLIHELVEQREKQLGTTAAQRGYGSATTGAHSKGLTAELGVIGAVLESDSGLVGGTANPDGTMNGTRTVVFKYPDGTRYRVEVTLSHNNITGVVRTKLP